MTMKGWKPWVLLALLGAASWAHAEVSRTEEFNYPLNDGGRVSLSNINGDIRVTGGNDGAVTIVATRRANSEEALERLKVVIDASPDAIIIETRRPESRWSWNNSGGGSVAYELTVPESARLDGVSTVNGDVTVSGVGGEVRAETVNGDLELDGLAADAGLDTVNGAIRARFSRVGGNQRISADTVNGRIELDLPADTSARVTADTLNGGMDVGDFGLEVDKGYVGREVDGDIGSGDARIKLDTVNGTIRLRRY
ncbi:DUF4097 family beta strand repeat-containing protein [Elongatibacter sediminis]|uniref:DUF4097 family beta strand repeat-containing protein n=1 Tax=Elongatibacter sediminis TaxID=3119006 RepID=A0AAW9RDF1_9GAMM